VKRHERVTVEAYDQAGKKFTRHASGLMAQIFQHEIAHLDGGLFIDEAWDLHEVLTADAKHD
jgi:peptide deformylase